MYNFCRGDNMRRNTLRLLALTLALTMLFISSGCQRLTDAMDSLVGLYKDITVSPQSTTQAPTEPETTVTSYDITDLRYGYYALQTEAQRTLYKKFLEIIRNISDEKNTDGFYPIDKIEMTEEHLTEGGIRIVIEAFSCDHPEVFWLSNVFGYFSGNKITMVHLYSLFNNQEIDSMQKEIDVATNDILKTIPDGRGEYEREKIIHDKIIEHCTYATGVKNSKDNPYAFSIYGALVKHLAVCEGYTKATQYLLRKVGIQSISVNGYSKNELHQWCMVSINQNWYHLDTTWDERQVLNDEDRKKEVDNILYFYFNTTDSYIEADHRIAKPFTELSEEQLCGTDAAKTQIFNLPLPVCTSEKDTFYNREGALLTNFDSITEYDNIVDKLYKVAKDKKKSFYFKIGDNLNFNTTVDELFYEKPYQFFEYTTDVNLLIGNDFNRAYRINDRITMITLEAQKIIKIELDYVKWK